MVVSLVVLLHSCVPSACHALIAAVGETSSQPGFRSLNGYGTFIGTTAFAAHCATLQFGSIKFASVICSENQGVCR
jgi:hypothetical protein